MEDRCTDWKHQVQYLLHVKLVVNDDVIKVETGNFYSPSVSKWYHCWWLGNRDRFCFLRVANTNATGQNMSLVGLHFYRRFRAWWPTEQHRITLCSQQFLSLLRLYVLVLFVPSPQPIISSSALIAQWGRPGPGEEVLIRSCASLRRQRPLEWGLLAFKPLSQRFWPFLFFSLSLVSWLVICLFVTKSHSFGYFKSVICPIGPPKGGMCRSSRSSSRACHFTILPFLFFGGNSECGHAPE